MTNAEYENRKVTLLAEFADTSRKLYWEEDPEARKLLIRKLNNKLASEVYEMFDTHATKETV